jgi:Asp/Glu/hydantoin racemase
MALTIAYIHTSHVLIPLFSGLSKTVIPEAEQFHMVDESLIRNTIRSQGLTKNTIRRVIGMVESAYEGGADAVLVTCSSIGEATSAAARLFDFPVVRVDEAMAEEAVSKGRRIGVAATLRTTLEPTVALLRHKAADALRDVEIIEVLCEGAFEAVLAGDTATHDRILTQSLTHLLTESDVVVLAQASMARVAAQMPSQAGRAPILASPELAVHRLRSVVFPRPV